MKKIVLILSLVAIVGCANESDPVSTILSHKDFGIYFLKDSNLREYDVADKNIMDLELQETSWLLGDDIEYYDYSTHCIYLKKDKSFFIPNFEDHRFMFEYSMSSKPFVVVAGYKRCYVGAFHSFLLSSLPIGPIIDEISIGNYPDDVIHIWQAWSEDGGDHRSHPEIEEALKCEGIFHAGPELILNRVEVVENGDTATVEYNFAIKNNDVDNLYVLDPDKIGLELFNYYSGPPYLKGVDSQIVIRPIYHEHISPEPYSSEYNKWLTLVKSNEEISFTLQIRGYQYIPGGKYKTQIRYMNPRMISKDNRNLDNGRIWIGHIVSNEVEINVVK